MLSQFRTAFVRPLSLVVFLLVFKGFALAEQPPMSAGIEGEIYQSTGIVTDIDEAYDYISILHPPIKELNWDEMDMVFLVTSFDLLKDVKVGDKVAYDFTVFDYIPTIGSITVIKE